MNEIWIETAHDKIFGMTAGDPATPAVIGLHGRSQRNGWHTWEPLVTPLVDVGFYVILFDMPGWGKSAVRDGFNPAEVVVDIMQCMNIETAALMGKSWGGGIAIDLAQTHPDKFEKLILTAPAYRGDLAELGRLTKPVLLAWAEDDEVIPYTYATMFSGGLPNCTLETYVTGGHSAAMGNVDDFGPKAAAFLKK